MDRLKLGIRGKLFLISLALIAVTGTIANLLFTRSVDRLLTERIRQDLRVRAALIAREVAVQHPPEPTPASAWQALAQELAARAEVRVSLIDRSGVVRADSSVPLGLIGKMDNHRQRPEVHAALSGRTGEDDHLSTTVGRRMYYVAEPIVRGGSVVGAARVAMAMSDVDRAIWGLRRILGIASIVAILVAVFMSMAAAHVAARSVRKLTATALLMARGDLTQRSRVTGRDEIGALGRALDRMAERLQRLETLRKDFVANVSHELRTPIAAVHSAAETLKLSALQDPEAAARFTDIVLRNADRLQQLVEDLLDLSRIETQGFRLEPAPVSVDVALAHVQGLFHKRAEDKGITLSLVVPPGLPPLRGDQRALEQVLTNLVDNAIKYCSRGAEVRMEAQLDRAGRMVLRVADNGPGIGEAHIPRIFERFYRADEGRSREQGGTGLGLAIVKHLVEAMQGEVRVHSTAGAGATFSVILPLWRGV